MVIQMTGKKIYKSSLSIVLIIMLFIMTMFISLAEESDLVSIEVSDTSLQMGSSVTVTLSMDASIDAKEIGVNGLENFNVDSSTQSSSSSNINGVKSSIYQYILTLSPKAIGEFSLKAVVNDGKTNYESQEVIMTVSKRDESLDDESADVFIKTILSGTDHYFGENIVLAYELYSRYNLNDFGFLDEVKYDEFIVESTPKEELESNVVTINGNKYIKQVVREDVLVPTRSGQFEIPSYRFQANLSTGDFFSRSEPRYLDTEGVTITVNELPATNKPVKFTGIVGKLNVKSSVDKTEVAYGDAITLKVLLTGTGNLDSIDSLYNEKQNGFTIYETEKSKEKNIVDLEYAESKEYEIIIVPEDAGNLNLEAVELGYFDTELNDYAVIEIPEQSFVVTGVKNEVNTVTESMTTLETVLINQVNYKDSNEDMFTIQISKRVVLLLILLMIGILILIIIIRKVKSRPDSHNKKEYLKLLNTAKTSELLEVLVEKIINEKTSLNLKSQHRKTLITFFDTDEEKELIESIILDVESNKVSQKQDISNTKKKLKRLIEIMF